MMELTIINFNIQKSDAVTGKEAGTHLFREPPVAARRRGARAEITPELAAERRFVQ